MEKNHLFITGITIVVLLINITIAYGISTLNWQLLFIAVKVAAFIIPILLGSLIYIIFKRWKNKTKAGEDSE